MCVARVSLYRRGWPRKNKTIKAKRNSKLKPKRLTTSETLSTSAFPVYLGLGFTIITVNNINSVITTGEFWLISDKQNAGGCEQVNKC
jgi:hypothetical protein